VVVGVVGCVATYDARLPTEETVYNWFWIRNKQDNTLTTRHSKRRKKGGDSMSVPMQLQYHTVQEKAISLSVVQAMVHTRPPAHHHYHR
jgi:hypothetical protein